MQKYKHMQKTNKYKNKIQNTKIQSNKTHNKHYTKLQQSNIPTYKNTKTKYKQKQLQKYKQLQTHTKIIIITKSRLYIFTNYIYTNTHTKYNNKHIIFINYVH